MHLVCILKPSAFLGGKRTMQLSKVLKKLVTTLVSNCEGFWNGKQFGGSGIKYFIDCIEDIHKESCFEIIRNIKNKKVLYVSDALHLRHIASGAPMLRISDPSLILLNYK